MSEQFTVSNEWPETFWTEFYQSVRVPRADGLGGWIDDARCMILLFGVPQQ